MLRFQVRINKIGLFSINVNCFSVKLKRTCSGSSVAVYAWSLTARGFQDSLSVDVIRAIVIPF